MLIWLGLCAVACFAGGLLLLHLGTLSVLAAAHLVFALGILPLIFGAISHFVPVLTRSGPPGRLLRTLPFLLQGVGLLAFLGFAEHPLWLHPAATAGLVLACAFAGWLLVRARRTLGKPHPGWRWYLAAIGVLALALALVPPMLLWPELRQPLRLAHLHLNTLGFIGLTAIGTLQVLLPTVLSGPDAEAAARLRRDLPLALGGVLAVALGAAFWRPLALLGALLLLAVCLRLGRAWLHRYGWRTLAGDGAGAALGVALLGFVALIDVGVAHAFGVTEGRAAVAAFVLAFLLPLVTGALSQLLPVWRWPGPRTPVRDAMRALLVAGGAARALAFLLAGTLLLAGSDGGYWLAAAALLHFALALLRALVSRKRPESPGGC